MRKLSKLGVRSASNKKLWSKLYGLGKGLWNVEDAQVSVSYLREDQR